MCPPLALTVLTVAQAGLQIASGIAQAKAQRAQGEAQNNYYNYLADVNQQQALIAERTGRNQSKVNQDVQMVQGKRLAISQAENRASQSAALAASGVPLSSVTAEDISKTTFTKQALDENLLRYNADVRSYEAITGSMNQAFGLRSQGAGYRAAGANALTAARLNSRSTLLSSAFGAVGTLSNVFTPFASKAPTTTPKPVFETSFTRRGNTLYKNSTVR